MRAAINDHFIVRRIVCAAVVARLVGQAFDVFAVDVHRVQLKVAVTLGCKDDLLAVRAYGRLGVITGRIGQILDILAVRSCGINFVIPINRPNIAFWPVGLRRAFSFAAKGRRVEHLFATLEKIRARGASLAIRDHVNVRAVDVHRVDLIAGAPVALWLKDQLLAVKRKISLCIFAAKR